MFSVQLTPTPKRIALCEHLQKTFRGVSLTIIRNLRSDMDGRIQLEIDDNDEAVNAFCKGLVEIAQSRER